MYTSYGNSPFLFKQKKKKNKGKRMESAVATAVDHDRWPLPGATGQLK